MGRADDYQQHLDRVSRSFAFCIARLEGEMREWVGLSYLLCRTLDTVEDAAWPTGEARALAFQDFERFLSCTPTADEVSAWVARFPENVPSSERLLLQDSVRIFGDLEALPVSVREKIRTPVLNMYRGMRHFGANEGSAGLRLESLAEVNQYCFFVAGLVGGLLTDLLGERWPGLASNRALYLDAHHFGLFLQKVNLLKDQATDEREGRFLVPSRREMLASLKGDAEGALRYLQSLPLAEKGFRLFCAWSLFLGLASLPWVEKSRALGVFTKIPRLLTQSLLASVEKVIDDNQALVALFQKMLPVLPPLAVAAREFAPEPWISQAYVGRLSEQEFAALGMLPAGG
jgi:phytoene/squalene synthetase